MDLVIHHVFEALVVSGAEEDLRGQLATRETVIQHLRERRQHGVGANKKPLVRITHQKNPKRSEGNVRYWIRHITLWTYPAYLVSSEVVAVLRQQVRHFLHVHSVVKWRGVTNLPFIRRNLA